MLRVWYHVERDVVLLRHGSGLGLVPGDRPGLSPHRVEDGMLPVSGCGGWSAGHLHLLILDSILVGCVVWVSRSRCRSNVLPLPFLFGGCLGKKIMRIVA